MEKYLFDSELTIMNILWKNGGLTAKEIAGFTKEQVGWSKTTTYTVLKNCINKGLIRRTEPHFFCTPLVTEKEAQTRETELLVKRLYHDSSDLLIAALLEQKAESPECLERIRKLLEDAE